MSVKSKVLGKVKVINDRRKTKRTIEKYAKEDPALMERAKEKVRQDILQNEGGLNPAYARQVADGDISFAEGKRLTQNQDRRLGVGSEQEVMDDLTFVDSVRDADGEGTKLFEWKQSLPDEAKEAVTDAEIAYKRGNPKPLAKLYKTMGAVGAVGGANALAAEDAEAKPSLILKAGLDATTAARQIKNNINRSGVSGGKAVERFIHENTNYDKGFTKGASKWDKGRGGDTYIQGLKKMAHELIKSTDDPQVRSAIMDWLVPRLQRAVVPVAGVGMSNASLANTHVKDSGHISAPRSGGMFDFTMGLRDLGRRLEGSPAQLLNPDGVAQYLETVNRREENPNWETRLFALLDFL